MHNTIATPSVIMSDRCPSCGVYVPVHRTTEAVECWSCAAWVLPDRTQIVGVHTTLDCLRMPSCALHRRSDHHLRHFPQVHQLIANSPESVVHSWWGPMQRMCPHGIGHPDPDNSYHILHNIDCDGCCRTDSEWADVEQHPLSEDTEMSESSESSYSFWV